MLRQIEWGVQNGPITKKAVLPLSTLFFGKFCFIITTYKELTQSINHSKVSTTQSTQRVLFPFEYP